MIFFYRLDCMLGGKKDRQSLPQCSVTYEGTVAQIVILFPDLDKRRADFSDWFPEHHRTHAGGPRRP